MMAMTTNATRFPLGATQATPAALDHLVAAGVTARELLVRHAAGDWGEVPAEDAAENELSVRVGFRIISNYVIAGEKVWIITEADRSLTTVLLAQEY
jgi:hypothetical protein